MKVSRMLWSSAILTISMATIAILLLIFTSEDSPAKQLEEKRKATEREHVKIAESPKEEVPASTNEGIRTETDHLGVHHILFESGKIDLQAKTGPITVTVQESGLQQLTADNEAIQRFLVGGETSTIVVLDVKIENTSEEEVTYNFNEAKIEADTGEVTAINPKLSTRFATSLAAKTAQTGTVMIDFATEARDIATIQLTTLPAYNKEYDELGDAMQLKVPMY